MTKSLHILNGDSSRYLIEKSGLDGDHLVWRELLCDGPVEPSVGSDPFWKARYHFFQESLKVDKLQYFDQVIKELVRIEDLSAYDEVTLWFEYDLFCQVNLLACCSYLLSYYKKDISYYLICVGQENDRKELMSLGYYAPEDFPRLFENRVKLSRTDLVFADECWKLFSNGSRRALKAFDFAKNKKFKYLQKAIDQHLENSSKLTQITALEQRILSHIDEAKLSKRALIKRLLEWQQTETVNGFGDLQYERYLDKLAPYYSITNDVYTLNKKGIDALK